MHVVIFHFTNKYIKHTASNKFMIKIKAKIYNFLKYACCYIPFYKQIY